MYKDLTTGRQDDANHRVITESDDDETSADGDANLMTRKTMAPVVSSTAAKRALSSPLPMDVPAAGRFQEEKEEGITWSIYLHSTTKRVRLPIVNIGLKVVKHKVVLGPRQHKNNGCYKSSRGNCVGATAAKGFSLNRVPSRVSSCPGNSLSLFDCSSLAREMQQRGTFYRRESVVKNAEAIDLTERDRWSNDENGGG